MNFIFDKLREEKKDIIIYGTGDGADKLVSVLSDYSLKPCAVCCSDERYKEKVFYGLPLMKLSDAVKKYGDNSVFLIAFGTHDECLMREINTLSERFEVFIPDLPVAGKGLLTPDILENDKEEIRKARDRLYDEQSRALFDTIINAKISGEVKYFSENLSPRTLMPSDIFEEKKYDIFADLGAYYGDTVEEFIKAMPDYKKIYAIEPDAYNFRRLRKNFEGTDKVKLLNALAGSENGIKYISKSSGRGTRSTQSGREIKCIRVDSFPEKPSLIKFDVEGDELQALEGCGDLLFGNNAPDLILSVYHRAYDFYRLINYVFEINENYKAYLHRFPCFPLWEIQAYFVI